MSHIDFSTPFVDHLGSYKINNIFRGLYNHQLWCAAEKLFNSGQAATVPELSKWQIFCIIQFYVMLHTCLIKQTWRITRVSC